MLEGVGEGRESGLQVGGGQDVDLTSCGWTLRVRRGGNEAKQESGERHDRSKMTQGTEAG
jgi:hypothetical protein